MRRPRKARNVLETPFIACERTPSSTRLFLFSVDCLWRQTPEVYIRSTLSSLEILMGKLRMKIILLYFISIAVSSRILFSSSSSRRTTQNLWRKISSFRLLMLLCLFSCKPLRKIFISQICELGRSEAREQQYASRSTFFGNSFREGNGIVKKTVQEKTLRCCWESLSSAKIIVTTLKCCSINTSREWRDG